MLGEREIIKKGGKSMDSKWYKSKIFWAMITAIVATAGSVVMGEVSLGAAIVPLISQIAAAIFRLFFNHDNT